ncbi:MAG: hypothetical protein JWM80_6324 [Cyanobacteria bacterium RYN_339]|nr:hypothetical protein [Cyanobacteria bacterium RYN_339]
MLSRTSRSKGFFMAHILIVSTGTKPAMAAIAAQVCRIEGHTTRIVSRVPERSDGADLVMLALDREARIPSDPGTVDLVWERAAPPSALKRAIRERLATG